jgi:ureidoglycolate dehydrogenase (NAD+)
MSIPLLQLSTCPQPEAHQDLGHFFILIDTKRLAQPDVLAGRMEDFKSIIRSTPAADAARPVRLPGGMEFENLRRQRREGVSIAAEDLADLEKLAGRVTA